MGDRYEHDPSDQQEASSSYSEDGLSSAEARDHYRGVDAYSGSDDTVSSLIASCAFSLDARLLIGSASWTL